MMLLRLCWHATVSELLHGRHAARLNIVVAFLCCGEALNAPLLYGAKIRRTIFARVAIGVFLSSTRSGDAVLGGADDVGNPAAALRRCRGASEAQGRDVVA